MFRASKNTGDSLLVPQLVFSRLGFPEVDEPRVKVALYVLAAGDCDVEQVASNLHIQPQQAEKALLYWEGAGLLERVAQQGELPKSLPKSRVRMSMGQANLAAANDPILGAMVQELQHILGGLINQREYEIYCTLYCEDEFPADMILMAAMHCTAEQKSGASRVERTLLAWRKEGIHTCGEVDAYLRLLEEREARYRELAEIFGQDKAMFTSAERRIVDGWHEKFAYGMDMVEAARLVAGEKENEIRYINGIFKKWQTKGYATTDDVRRGEQASNVVVQGNTKPPKEDLLQNTYFNPIKRKGDGA